MKRTIFFDLGNVLIFFDHQKMCQQVSDYTGLDMDWVVEVMQKYMDPYERGSADSKMIYDEICRMAQKKLDFSTLMHAVSDIFQPNVETIAIAHEVKARGHRIFLLSNTCDAHFAHASKQFPFLKIFDGFVLSYEVGARKPEKKIYEKALEIAGCQNKESFYTDDIAAYVESARSLEIDAEQYTTPQNLKQHLILRGIL
jgi:FMN phosphatase YigB (HAD superfamily)